MKPLLVYQTFNPLSNGMHNSILTKMTLRTLALKQQNVRFYLSYDIKIIL